MTLFDLGALGLLLAWGICWSQRRWPSHAPKVAIAALVALSSLIMVAALAWRGALAGHWPLTSAYEFCLALVLSTSIAYLVVGLSADRAGLGLAVLPVALLLAAYARWGIPPGNQTIQPVVPALQSLWLPIHVLTAALAYGFFAVACGAALDWFVMHGPADREMAEGAMTGAVRFGYLWMSGSLLSGAVWAQMAWGSYWSWDPKEVWALTVWLMYTLFLHARYRQGWAGRRLAALAVLGFVAVMFTFLGVGPLARSTGLGSLHVF